MRSPPLPAEPALTPIAFVRAIALAYERRGLSPGRALAQAQIAPQLLQTTRFGLFHVIASYLFVMVPNPAGLIEPVLTVGWTLNYEMLYYVIFGLTLVLPTAWRFATTTLVLLGLSMLGWFVVGDDTPILKVYTSDIVLEFVLGMSVGWWFSRPHKGGSATLGWALVLGGFVVIGLMSVLAPNASRPLAQGVPAAAIVVGAILLERFQALPRMNFLHKLGDASYSLYLSHAFVLSAVSQGWRKLHLDSLPGGQVAFCVVGIVASRVKDRLHRPTFVFAASQAPGKEHELKGSGRSIPGFHLRDALDLVGKRHPGLLLRFGGHAMAAGCTIPEEGFEAFEQAFSRVAQEWLDAATLTRCVETDGPLRPEFRQAEMVERLNLDVWGQGFAHPTFSEEVEVVSQRLVGEKHLKLQLRHQGDVVDGIWFGRTEPVPERVYMAFRLDINEWRGERKVQFLIEGAEC